jgi:hypothetical protein
LSLSIGASTSKRTNRKYLLRTKIPITGLNLLLERSLVENISILNFISVLSMQSLTSNTQISSSKISQLHLLETHQRVWSHSPKQIPWKIQKCQCRHMLVVILNFWASLWSNST